MTAFLWMAAALLCAQEVQGGEQEAKNPAQTVEKAEEDAARPRTAASKIDAVTVYQGQALVTREVEVPEGEGTLELVVAPLPPATIDGSLFTEGTDGLRVLSTRFRSRAVKDDTRREVRAAETLVKELEDNALKLQKEADAHEQDIKYLDKLEGFTAAALNGLSNRGRLDSSAVLTLSKFIMENRGAKTDAETDLRRQMRDNARAVEFARTKLAELAAGSGHVERDAVIVIQKTRGAKGTVRLGYLAGAATWTPQYRLRGAADAAPVRLEYLAAVVQQTGEAWPAVQVALSTARPSQDSAPPELLPLKMAVSDPVNSGPIESADNTSRKIVAELDKAIDMQFPNETPLSDVLKYIRGATQSQVYPQGIPIYVDPVGLQEAEKTEDSPIVLDLTRVPLRTSLRLLLRQLGMTYRVKDGLLQITSESSDDAPDENDDGRGGFSGRMGVGLDSGRAFGGALLNQAAASDQAKEFRVSDGEGAEPSAGEKDNPSVTFAVKGRFDVPSRKDPQLLDVARIELPAEFYAKAVPVLTPRVYRLAKLTNTSDLVLLPGEAAVHVGGDFVGRMRLPLVAAGEPFLAGFGVDPQLQVSRRLVRKARTVQGGNQIFTYEFRIGLRNYRSVPVKVQLWDRLPKPEGESVAATLVKTSAELSTDALYLRTARLDNLLRWDLEVPKGTIGDKTMYLNYELRLEYARDLPQPRFLSGGLRENPIGGGAMGGMGGMGGGMGGGMRSVKPAER